MAKKEFFFVGPARAHHCLPSSVSGLTDWGDESEMLAQVLAMSQAEYLETLKANKNKDDQQPGSSSS